MIFNQDNSDLIGAIKRNIFAVKGRLISNVTATGNIFTQTTPSDSRITTNTEVASVNFYSTDYITSNTIKVIPGTGTVTISGTTKAFSDTILCIVELYND